MRKRHNYAFWVYLLASKRNGTLYVGMTNDLRRRVFEHSTKLNKESFTARHDVHTLVWYEFHSYVYDAIAREKEIKNMLREKKLALIESKNPQWVDLLGEVE